MTARNVPEVNLALDQHLTHFFFHSRENVKVVLLIATLEALG